MDKNSLFVRRNIGDFALCGNEKTAHNGVLSLWAENRTGG